MRWQGLKRKCALGLMLAVTAVTPAMPQSSDAPYWRLNSSRESNRQYFAGAKKDRLAISIVNIEEAHVILRAHRSGPFYDTRIDPLSAEAQIPIELQITASGFAPDYLFETGFSFVSARFREVADLPLDKVQYLDAPCNICTPEAKAKDYKVLWVHHFEDVLDPARTIIRDATRLTPEQLMTTRDTYVYRDGHQVGSPVFHLSDRGFIMVTDALARRLARAKLDGVALEDLTSLTPDLQRPTLEVGD